MIGYREEQVLEKLDQIIALLGELNLAGQGKGERKAGSQRPKYTRDMGSQGISSSRASNYLYEIS